MEATGIKGARFPYKKAAAAGSVTITGLPEGIPFKKPVFYGSKQRRIIWERNNDISCIIDNTGKYLHACLRAIHISQSSKFS